VVVRLRFFLHKIDMIKLLGRIKENPKETKIIIDDIIAKNRLALKIL